MLSNLYNEVKKASDPEKGKFLQRFFKTGEGQYGYGDLFAGLTVPQSRAIAQKYKHLDLKHIKILIKSKIHEERLIALLILVYQFKRANSIFRKQIFDFYLSHTTFINNWDLVDLSADKIVGEYLLDTVHNGNFELQGSEAATATKNVRGVLNRKRIIYKDRMLILEKLAYSENLWERRIAIIATFAFIKSGRFNETLKIAKILLKDREDLIHKATGWMLREGGEKGIAKGGRRFLAQTL